MTRADFAMLNTQQKEKGQKPFANPRNAALVPTPKGPGHFSSTAFKIFAYAPGRPATVASTHSEFLDLLRWVCESPKPASVEGVLAHYDTIKAQRNRLNYGLTG